jgi:hypothetical protein
MMMKTRRTMRAKALQTDACRLRFIEPGCMIVVTNEIEANPYQPCKRDKSSIHVRSHHNHMHMVKLYSRRTSSNSC